MAKVVLVGYGAMLYSLIEGIKESSHEILGVLRCDRTKYTSFELFFKDIFAPSRDYTIIKSEKLSEIKANSVNSTAFIKEIKRLKPDMIICGSWGEKFKKEILELVTCVNFHPALLPKNRGANPYFWSIYLNQQVSGLSVHYMNEDFDKGDIILQEAIPISEIETGASLKEKTVLVAKVLVKKLLDLFDAKQIQPIKQDEKYASYEPQLSEREVIIDLNKTKQETLRHLRALYPWASPYVKVNNCFVKFEKYEFLDCIENKKPHEVIQKGNGYLILAGQGFYLKIYSL